LNYKSWIHRKAWAQGHGYLLSLKLKTAAGAVLDRDG
jgi:hypothetical protein